MPGDALPVRHPQLPDHRHQPLRPVGAVDEIGRLQRSSVGCAGHDRRVQRGGLIATAGAASS